MLNRTDRLLGTSSAAAHGLLSEPLVQLLLLLTAAGTSCHLLRPVGPRGLPSN